jgi:hypothetical protein
VNIPHPEFREVVGNILSLQVATVTLISRTFDKLRNIQVAEVLRGTILVHEPVEQLAVLSI